MPTFAEIKTAADNPQGIHKQLELVCFLAPYSAAAITSLTDVSGDLVAIPTEYEPVGVMSTDGVTWGADTNVEEVESLGYGQPTRRDITRVTKTVAFTAQEAYKQNLLGLTRGMDLSAVVQAASGEVTWDTPDIPQQIFYRFLAIGLDGGPGVEFYRAKFLPRVTLSEVPEEVWSATDPTQYPITLSAFIDDALGTAEREFIAGPGAAAADLGFTKGV